MALITETQGATILLWQDSMAHPELASYSQRLRLQIADLQELDHDIREFNGNSIVFHDLADDMAEIEQ